MEEAALQPKVFKLQVMEHHYKCIYPNPLPTCSNINHKYILQVSSSFSRILEPLITKLTSHFYAGGMQVGGATSSMVIISDWCIMYIPLLFHTLLVVHCLLDVVFLQQTPGRGLFYILEFPTL